MGNISNIIGKSFEPVIDTPENQLRNEMANHGITPPDSLVFDGQIHRFNAGTKGKSGQGDKTGWYVVYSDGVPAGVFGCWRLGIEINFRAEIGRKLTYAEEMAYSRRMSEAKALRDAERAKSQLSTSNIVEQIWTDGTHASPEHGYLVRKGIQPNGARVTGDGRLMIPLYDEHGVISSLQYIAVDGDKKYHPSGATGERFWHLGEKSDTIYISEGFATAATIYETTNQLTIIAFSASNLVPVTRIIKEKYPSSNIVIVADNDESGVGLKYADQASAKYGVSVIMPPEKGDANDYVQNGGDLKSLLTMQKKDWLIPADDFSQKPNPISWLIKGWVQENALIMVHGPSGGGKTFIVLDWCMSIASNIDNWFGNKTKSGEVVYLAGEGHHGLRGRVAAWKQHHKINNLTMWISGSGCDLNTPTGYQTVLTNIKALNIQPKIIVVDTLHRFLMGDENSSQDAKTMLDACGALISEFKCSVLLVHHTGVSDEAQHRARGSSAWRGALDIEVSVVPAKNDEPIQIIQRKSKDAELKAPLFCELLSVPINGWKDEDDEQIFSAIVNQVEHTESVTVKKDSKLQGYIKTFERAWWASGAEVREGSPYLTRSGLRELLEKDGIAERTIKNKLNSSRDDLIGFMINSEVISPFEHGWILLDEVQSSAMLLRKN